MSKRYAANDPAEWQWWIAVVHDGEQLFSCKIVPELPENGKPVVVTDGHARPVEIPIEGPFDSPYTAVNVIGLLMLGNPRDRVAISVGPLSENGRYKRPCFDIYDGPAAFRESFGRGKKRKEVAFSSWVVAQMIMAQRGRWPWWESTDGTVRKFMERFNVVDGPQNKRPPKRKRKVQEPEGREVKEARK